MPVSTVLRETITESSPHATATALLRARAARLIALLDEQINQCLDQILHHPRLQALEARWRGLQALTVAADGAERVRIRVLDVSWSEVCRDLERAAEFDQSQLFHLIYSNEFGRAGGEPFGILLGDYAVSHRPGPQHPQDDVEALRDLAQIAAAAFAPLLLTASPRLFGLDSFQDLQPGIRLDTLFEQAEYSRWNSLRQLEDTRFLAIVLPGILARHPWQWRSSGGIRFEERCAGRDVDKYLWCSGIFALGSVIIREFEDIGWFAHIRGGPRNHVGGGLVTQFSALPMTFAGGQRHHILTPVLITDSLERELADQGLIALCHSYDSPFAVFHSCASLHRPRRQGSRDADANARISAMLQQLLCASRFAHYIKLLIRDKIGSFVTEDGCERLLQDWLGQYVSGRDDLPWEMQARYPLRQARVEVRELPGKPGRYSAIIHLKPHYVAEQLVSELRLTTELVQTTH